MTKKASANKFLSFAFENSLYYNAENVEFIVCLW